MFGTRIGGFQTKIKFLECIYNINCYTHNTRIMWNIIHKINYIYGYI